jgi:hypothetical protein
VARTGRAVTVFREMTLDWDGAVHRLRMTTSFRSIRGHFRSCTLFVANCKHVQFTVSMTVCVWAGGVQGHAEGIGALVAAHEAILRGQAGIARLVREVGLTAVADGHSAFNIS